MARDPRAYILDALAAATFIKKTIAQVTLEQYIADESIQAIVERKLITIGEALAAAWTTDSTIANSIRNLRRIVGMRNFVVHVYHAVSNETVWDVCHEDLDLLIEDLRTLLGEP